MVRSMKCFSFVFDLSVSSGDRLAYSFHISKLICKGQMRVNERDNIESVVNVIFSHILLLKMISVENRPTFL